MRLRLLTFSIACLLATGASADRVDQWAKEQMTKRHIPGMAIGIYRHGKPIKLATYGYADLENQVKVRKDSLFEACSITKQFTAASLLLLAEDGKLTLDDPVSKHIPEWPTAWATITLRDLAQHISGLNDENFDFQPKPIAEFIKPLAKNLIEPRATAWEYSNFGYSILGKVIEKVSGQPYYAFMKSRIFDKLGMRDTQPNDTSRVTPRRVRGYGWDGKANVNRDWLPAEVGYSSGGLLTSVEDLNRWSEALKHRKLLKKEKRAAMLEPARLSGGDMAWPEGMARGYGLGVFLAGTPGRRIEKHSGGWSDASAQLTRFLDDDLTVIVLTNYGGWAERPFVGESIGALVLLYSPLPTFEAKVDPDPERTKSFAAILLQLSKKQLPKDALAPRLRVLATFDSATAAAMASEIDFARLKFVEKVPQGARAIYVYRTEGAEPSIVHFSLSADGKLESFSSFPVPK